MILRSFVNTHPGYFKNVLQMQVTFTKQGWYSQNFLKTTNDHSLG